MKRRDFLKNSMFTASTMSAAGLSTNILFPDTAWAGTSDRVLNNVMLLGGADMRHLLVPPPTTNYGQTYWTNRESVHAYNLSNPDEPLAYDPQTVWNNEYSSVTAGDLTFGINNNAGWLQQQFAAGNVAIFCNVNGSENQRHDHSQLIMNSGKHNITNYDYDTSGWGGRLSEYIGGISANANTVSFPKNISIFCNGENQGARSAHTISAPDTRDIALADPAALSGSKAVMARTLKAYYAKRGIELTGPEAKFAAHEIKLRQFGGLVDSALAGVSVPASLSDLKSGGASALYHTEFADQLASLYDAHQVNQTNFDILKFRVASLEYNHWDTHTKEKAGIEHNISDIFGSDRGMERLQAALGSTVWDDQVFVFTSDFGRQIRSNGSGGTDHGKGTYMFVIGNAVRGGVYGEMFPDYELIANRNYRNQLLIPYDQPGAWIQGRTSMVHILGEVCDWVGGMGAGDVVFPGRASNTQIEKDSFGNNIPVGTLFAGAVYSISGVVSDEFGAPLPNVVVTVSDILTGQWSVTTDANGYYTIANLVPGTYDVSANKKLHTIASLSIDLNLGDIVRNLIATLLPGTISGKVLNEAGEGIPGVTVWDPNTWPGSSVTTDEHGRYMIAGFSADQSINLFISSSNHSFTPSTLAFSHSGGAESGHDFTGVLKTGTVSGKIITTEGIPVAGLTIWDATTYPDNITTTDQYGNYILNGFNAGQHVTLVTSVNTSFIVSPSNDYFVHDGGAASGHNFTAVIAAGTVSGHVLTSSGEGVAGYEVWDIFTYGTRGFVTTDSRGFYILEGFSVGDNVWMNAYDANKKTTFNSATMFTHDGSAMNFGMTADYLDTVATLSGSISSLSGEPVAGLKVEIWDKITSSFIRSVTTDAQGMYSTQLLDGTYQILPDSTYESIFTATDGSNSLIVSGVDVIKNFTGESIVFELSGSLMTASGRPAAGVQVDVYQTSNGDFLRTSFTDANGRYSVLLRQGRYVVSPVANSDYASFTPVDGTARVLIDAAKVEDWLVVPVQYSLSGMLTTVSGFLIRNHQLSITNAFGYQSTVVTDANAKYQQNVESGTIYTLSAVSGEPYAFTPVVVSVSGSAAILNITGVAIVDVDSDEISNQDDNCTEVANFDQRDSNGDGYGNICDPDLDNDGDVDRRDVWTLKKRLGTSDADADLDGDGLVTSLDREILNKYYKSVPGPSGLN